MILDRRVLSIVLLLAAGILAIYVSLLVATASGAQTDDSDITGIDDNCVEYEDELTPEDSIPDDVVDETPTSGPLPNTGDDENIGETSVVVEDDAACETSVIDGLTELNVNKSDTPDPVEVGDLLLYNIVVDNADNETAANVVLEDDLPDSVDFIAADIEGGSGQGECEAANDRVVCVFGPLGPDERATVRILVEPNEEGVIENVARVSLEGELTPVDEDREQTSVVGNEIPDATPPKVASVKPTDGREKVRRGTNITATFSEEMNPDTLTASTVFLVNTRTGGAVAAKVSCDDPCTTVTLNSWTRLAKNRTYKAIITTDAEDLAGNAMEQNYTWTFRTRA